MANKKYEDFIYRDFIGDTISQDEFEEIMLEVLEEEERFVDLFGSGKCLFTGFCEFGGVGVFEKGGRRDF